MTAGRWRMVEELFHAAVALDPAEREPWLERQCTGDAELAREVRRMLDADLPDSATIDNLIGNSVTEWLDRTSGPPPERLGPWRIVKPIGRGGMGSVYLAARDDDSYRQLAAVKVLRPEQLAPGMFERFRQERQILAELDHPNIARLLDGGTTSDGRPYLVLEYVDGVPLAEFARTLPLRERCALFASVCDAVAYAHRNLIVHRDLKPANILVDSRGGPKLLDFGIAKLIGVDASMTSSMHALFTPDYASPEQVRGEPITTATDVYALGVVLYEVLTGKPLRSAASSSFADLIKDITEGETRLPSKAASIKIPNDLDRIVEKALSREPDLRYGTADQLASDLRRYLEGRPVEARGQSWHYTASKFARRYWMALAAMALFVCGLAASTAWSLRQARIAAQAQMQAEQERDRAERERQRAQLALAETGRQKAIAERNAAEAAVQRASAQDRFDRSRKLTHKFLFEVEDALKGAVGATKARQVLVTTALGHFEQMGREAGGDRDLMLDLARSYDRIGDLQGNPAAPANLGDTAGALKSYRQAMVWYRKRWEEPIPRMLAGATMAKLANVLRWHDEIQESEKAFADAAAIFASVSGKLPKEYDLELMRYRANLYRAWGEHWQSRAMHDKAVKMLSTSVDDLKKMVAAQPEDLVFRRLLSNQYLTLSRSLVQLEDWREALRTAEAGMSVMREAIGPKPTIRDQSRLIPPGVQLVDVLEHGPLGIRNLPRALEVDAEMIAIGEKLVALDSANARNLALLANVLTRNGGHLRKSWRWVESREAYRRSISISEGLSKASPSNAFYRDLIGTGEGFLGQLLFDMHEDADAVRSLKRSIEILEAAVAAGRTTNKGNLLDAYDTLAQIELEQGGEAAAAPILARRRVLQP